MAYPIVLSTHAVGMSIVVGTVIIIDLSYSVTPVTRHLIYSKVVCGYLGRCCFEFHVWPGIVSFRSGQVFLSSGFLDKDWSDNNGNIFSIPVVASSNP